MCQDDSLDNHMSKCSYIQMSRPAAVTKPQQAVDNPCDAPHLDAARTEARRRGLMQSGTVQVLAETFRVLGDPTRVRILDALANGELCVCDIASLVGMSESAVSHQLRLLRTMRLVRPRRAGRQVFYSVDDHHILELLQLAGTHAQEGRTGTPTI